MSTHRELWRNVDVAYDVESGTLDIRDSDDNDKQLGLFCVIERDLTPEEEPFCTLLHKSNKLEIFIKPNEEL